MAASPIGPVEFAQWPGSATVLFARRARDGGRRLQGWHADVAQLVEHHLAKVRVAGSNPVVRSETANAVGSTERFSGSMAGLPSSVASFQRLPGGQGGHGGVAEWFRQGPAKPCTRVRFPSPPRKSRAISSVGERFPDTEEATGSIPVSPTHFRTPPGHGRQRFLLPSKMSTRPCNSARAGVVVSLTRK